MDLIEHSELEGKHALLSPSYHHWLNYDEQKLEAHFYSKMSASRGTALHKLAESMIKLKVRADPSEEAFACYVNDGIDLGMRAEHPLFFSDNCFGTPDTLSFRVENPDVSIRPMLRVHDLKNGVNATSFKQLEIYAGLFCLEYNVDPFEIDIELRIYQRSEVKVHEPMVDGIVAIMDKIVDFDFRIEALRRRNRW